MSEIIQEYTKPGTGRLKIDKPNGILFGVKILGAKSRNKRRYPLETLQKAISLYENAKVNLDHPEGDPNKPRSYTDRLGVIREVQLRGDEGLYADFHFNPNHPLAEQLLWDAEHAPTNVGFSHNVEAVLRRDKEETIVEEILSVRSVDLVADPATTKGLFESVGPEVCHLENPPLSLIKDDDVCECETLRKRTKAIETLIEQVFAGVKDKECRYVSFFKSSFLEAVYRCNGEEEVRRLVSDRLELVQQIREQSNEKHLTPLSVAGSPFETKPGENQDRRSFLEAITGD